MIQLSGNYRYFLFTRAADLRKGFDSLSGLVRSELNMNPLSGDIFIFLNKNRTLIKLLLWEGDGFSIYYKRLEQGTFELPESPSHQKQIALNNETLLLILCGIKLSSIKKRKRYTSCLK